MTDDHGQAIMTQDKCSPEGVHVNKFTAAERGPSVA